MGMTNFIITVVGVTAVVMLMKQDVRTSTRMLRNNLKHIRSWLEEAGEATGKAAQQVPEFEVGWCLHSPPGGAPSCMHGMMSPSSPLPFPAAQEIKQVTEAAKEMPKPPSTLPPPPSKTPEP